MAIPTTHVIDIEIHITYADKEGPFIKLFAQTDKNVAIVEKLFYQLRVLLESNGDLKPKTVNDLNVGLVCSAKFEDGNYYRAKILSLDNLQRDQKVSVLFIDYGNRADVDTKDIRLNSKIIGMLKNSNIEKVFEIPSSSHEFFLGGIAARSEWDNNTLELLRERLSNSDMKCSVCEVGGKKVITNITEAKINPMDIIKQQNKGFEIPMTTYIKKLLEMKNLHVLNQYNIPPPTVVDLTRQPPPTRIPNLAQPPPVGMMSQVGLHSFQQTNPTVASRLPGSMAIRPGIPGIPIRRPEISAMPQHSQPLQFSTDMIEVGVTHPVYVSHVDDGPYLFAVQIQNEVHNILVKMMADINNHEPKPVTAPLNPGSICLSRYAEDDSLCRAIVTNVTGDKVKLYFADFGNSEVVPYSEIYEIPPQFVEPKVISHRFTLANIKGVTYTDQQKILFKKLVANSNALHIKVTPPEENPLKQYCELFLNFKNIKAVMTEMMQSMPPLRYDPPQFPIKGSKVKVVVPFVLNPGRFFVQLELNSSQLHEIMDKVAVHCRTASHIPLSDLRAGDPCCAMYEDETWYRAEILRVYPDKAFINFVDYGNQEEVEHINLREISVDLVTNTRAQALVCCLKGYEMRYNVSEEISNRLEELILEKTLIMHVLGSTDSNVLIVELSDNGQDIGTLLDATPVHNTPLPSKMVPTETPAKTDSSWKETSQAAAPSNSREEPKYSDSRAPSDDGGKSWRSQQQDSNTTSRFNRGERNDGPPFEKKYNNEGEDKPWNRGESKFNRDENRGGRFNKDEEGGGRFNRDRDDGKRFGERKGRFNDDDKGGRFGGSESRGRFNSTDEDKPWKKRDDDAGGKWNNRDDGGSWKKDRESSDGGWKDRDGGSGGWKGRDGGGGGWKGKDGDGGGGGWKGKDGDGASGGWKGKDGGSGGGWKDGAGDRKSRFDGENSFKRGGGQDFGDRGSFRKPWDKGSGDSHETPKSPKPDSLGGIPYPTAKVGMTETTQVVFTTSPADFYLQLNSSADQLTELMDKIAKACESGEATDMPLVEAKMACLAKYAEDEAWYRAFIEEKSFDSAKVQFVDYGNQENVAFSDIKALPEDMNSLPAQAIKCRLYGVPETAEMGAFSDLTAEKSLLTQFVAKHFLTKSFQVVLIDEESGTNINVAMGAEEEEVLEALSKMGVKTLTKPQYSAGTSLTVQLTWYSNPSDFYVQPMASHPEFRAMMQTMQNVVRSGSVLQNNQLNIGDFVIARFKADKVLYRALVKETGYLPTVQYLDYGNTESIDSGSVWVMEPEYATLPIQAFNCSLAGVVPIGDSWSQANTAALDMHFEADTLECTVVKVSEDQAQYVVKLLKDGEEVAVKIIEAGLAAPDGGALAELDTSLLVGQLLPVTLLRVEDDSSFFVQPLAEDVELQSLETVAGEGFKCLVSNIREDASEEQQVQWKQLPANTVINILVDAVQNEGLQVTVYDQEGQLLPMLDGKEPAVEKICPLPVFNMHQKVTVAHAGEEGIFLHKVVFADQLSQLLQRCHEFYNESEEIDHKWIEGEFCAAKSVNDEQWYRARVLDTENDVKVQYIDYGNNESLPVSNLRKLDPAFYTPHAFTLKVTLHVSWNVPLENLLELAGETEYSAVILKSCDGWIVELVDNTGLSLTEKLVELGFATALENSPFKRVVEGGRFVEGSDISVTPTFIDSPLQLWVCVGDDIELVEALQDRLQEAASKLNSMEEPVGTFAAKYSDGLWYRAIKLSETTARFIDYGNSNTVDMSDIKELSADFLEPAEGYAVKVELPVGEFKEDAIERLNQLLLTEETDLEGEITAHILSVKETYIVADIFKGGQSVVDILVTENLCERLQTVSSGFVSHINSLNDFFIQEVGCEEALEAIANIMLTTDSFESTNEIEVGILVAALYGEDGLWYRAKVTEKSEDSIKVLFIDYGNSAVSTEFKSLPTDLASKPPLSKHCCLKLPSGVDKWSEAAFEKFLEISADGCTQFDVQFLNNDNPATVLLTFNGNNISEELKSLCDVLEKEIVDSENTSDHTGYNATVYISHINSVTDFYVQQEGTEAELDAIKEELSDVSSFEEIDHVTEDIKEQIVAALFTIDETWYRAKILETVDDETKVLFIDYGNTAVATKFVKLPETLSNKLPVATHCSLGRENLTEKANSYLATLADDGKMPFLMKIMKEGDPQIVSLIAENTIIEKELDQFALHSEDISDNIPDESVVKTVYLIQVNSPDDFFLHTAEATQQIEDISEQLIKAEGFPQVEASQVTKGEIVAAQFDEDDLWYRAKIIDKTENETKVLFIDYGNTAKVAKMKLLPEDLLSIPSLAMHCSLRRPGENQWSSRALETFNKLANDEAITFHFKIVSSQEETPLLVELYINGESVAEQLALVSGLISENQTDQTADTNETEDLFDEETSDTSLNKELFHDKPPTQVLSEFSEEHENKEVAQEAVPELNVDSSDEITKTCLTEVQISHFNNANDFYVLSFDDQNELSNITHDLLQAESFEAAVIEIGDMVAAQHNSDELWYRAKVLDTNASGSTVILVDSGCTVTAINFKKLPKDLAEKKPLAKHCCLKSPRGIWKEATKEKLSALAKIKDLTFEMKVIEYGEPCEIDLFVNGRSLIDTFTSDEMSDDLNNEMQNMILESVEKEVSSSLQNDMKDSTEQLNCNMEDTASNTFMPDELPDDVSNDLQNMNSETVEKNISSPLKNDVRDITEQSDEMQDELKNEIKNMILESFGKTISSSQQNDMQDITEQLICNIEETSSRNKENEIQQITGDVTSNAQDESKPSQEPANVITKSPVVDDNIIAVTNKQIDDDSNSLKEDVQVPDDSNALNEDVQVPEDSGDTNSKKETEPNTVYCSSNGHTNEDEFSQILVKPSTKTQSESENLCNRSPTTNRRMNIDEQIVPGCISIAKIEDSTDKP